MSGTCILFDASNVIYRSFHADAARPDGSLSAADGFPTGALHGWYRTLLKFQEDHNPALMVGVFDGGVPQHRLDACPEYKANRSKRDDRLVQQLDDAFINTPLLGIPCVKYAATEADDIIGDLAKRWDGKVIIVSDDKDLGQCVTDQVTQMKSPRKGSGWRPFGPAEVEDYFGIPPSKVADFLAITGDSSDNIAGLPNAGKVTAVKWLKAFGDIEGIIHNAATITPARFSSVITENAEQLRGFRSVTTLHDVPGPFPVATPSDPEKLLSYLNKRELRTVAARVIYLNSKANNPATEAHDIETPALAGPAKPAVSAPLPTQGMLF